MFHVAKLNYVFNSAKLPCYVNGKKSMSTGTGCCWSEEVPILFQFFFVLLNHSRVWDGRKLIFFCIKAHSNNNVKLNLYYVQYEFHVQYHHVSASKFFDIIKKNTQTNKQANKKNKFCKLTQSKNITLNWILFCCHVLAKAVEMFNLQKT